MGLFDIFRRKKKSEATSANSEVSSESQVTSATSAVSAASQEKLAISVASANEAVVSETASEGSAVVNSMSAAHATSESAGEPTESATSGENAERAASAESQSISNVAIGSVEAESVEASASAAVNSASADSTEADSAASEQQAPSDNVSSQGEEKSSQSASESSAAVADSAAQEAEEYSAESQEERYDRGLEKSRTGFGARLNRFLANFRHVDEDFFDDLEDLMIESDVGYDMAMKLSDSLQEEVKLRNAKTKQEVSNVIIEKMVSLYEEAGNGENNQINYAKSGPTVIMFVGVNGAGKTTTIGKLAARYKLQGKRVLLAAADTFRAGAVEQLDVWAKRDGVDIVTGPKNGDPAAVVFDGVKKVKNENYDLLLVDTAGRLQNKVNLMNELAKMKRIMSREIPDAPHEVLLVLDATTGQNALNQAKLFKESTDVTGIVLTKLDGTARGGIVLAIRNELHLPVKLVGLGEHVDDLADFDAREFVYGLFKGLVN